MKHIIEVVIEDADGNIYADLQLDCETGKLLTMPPKYDARIVTAAIKGALAAAKELHEKTTSA